MYGTKDSMKEKKKIQQGPYLNEVYNTLRKGGKEHCDINEQQKLFKMGFALNPQLLQII